MGSKMDLVCLGKAAQVMELLLLKAVNSQLLGLLRSFSNVGPWLDRSAAAAPDPSSHGTLDG